MLIARFVAFYNAENNGSKKASFLPIDVVVAQVGGTSADSNRGGCFPLNELYQ